MTTITVKQIPTRLHTALKSRAKKNKRSLNREIIECLENIVTPQKLDAGKFLAEVREYRNQLPGKLTDKMIENAKTVGRP